jgi:hypothetical protein
VRTFRFAYIDASSGMLPAPKHSGSRLQLEPARELAIIQSSHSVIYVDRFHILR